MPLDRTWFNSLIDDDGSGLTGSVWDKADVDALMDAIDAELLPDRCSVTAATVTTSATSGAWSIVNFDTIVWQSSPGMFTPPSTYIVVPKAGFYLVTGSVTFRPGAGTRALRIHVNSGVPAGHPGQEIVTPAHASAVIAVQVSAVVQCAVNGFVQLAVYQDSGATIVMDPIHPGATQHLQVTRLG